MNCWSIGRKCYDSMDLSIIIVNHNTPDLCRQTVDYVLESDMKDINYEIIVVDNSTKSEQIFNMNNSLVKTVTGIENKGFGHACNVGASLAAGKVLLFLNSDTIVCQDTIFKSWEYFVRNSEFGVLGIRTYLENGALDYGCKRGFPTPFNAICYFLKIDRIFPKMKIFGGYHLQYLDPEKTWVVDAVSGAYLMILADVYHQISGFDEEFFMYGEDLDLCFRVKQLGYKIVYFADSYMIHLKGKSGMKSKNPLVIWHFYHSMELFYKKHYYFKYGSLIRYTVLGAIRFKRWLSMRNLDSRP